MKYLLISICLSASLATSISAKPNVIYIIADDLGYADLSCYGQKQFPTPMIDQLASRGIRFTRHYSGSTVCAPSRCALMTGKDTGNCSVRGNGPFSLPIEETSLSKIAKQAGYNTAMIGKSCLTGNTQTPETILQHGFDLFYGTTDHKNGHFRYPKFIYKNNEKIDFPENQLHTGSHHDISLYTTAALNFISDQTDQKPFFLLLSYPVPHASVIASPEYLKQARKFVRNEKSFNKSNHYSTTPEVKANYIGMMLELDAAVGKIIFQLDKKNLLNDTLILFTSDNGPHTEGGFDPSFFDSTAPLRGSKRDLYEGGIRVPFIAFWPSSIKPNQTSDHPSAFWDFLPTFCELTGQPIPENIQGISFASTLIGKGQQQKHKHLYWEFHEKNFRRAIQVGDWKLVQYNLDIPKQTTTELYNLADDISESKNLAAEYPGKTAELLKLMSSVRKPSKNFPAPPLDNP